MRKDYYKDLVGDQELSKEGKSKKIFENWSNIAQEFGEEPSATIRDLYLRALNTQFVLKYLADSDVVVDIGCGNGFATSCYADHSKKTVGVDYIPEFVESARKLHKKDNLEFMVGNILNLENIRFAQFDKVIAERTLINLVSWEDQQTALKELDSLLKINGLLILTEVTLQGHKSVDDLRSKYGLSIIEKHWNNCYIDEDLLLLYLADSYDLVERYNFGFYSLISKVIYPASIYPEEPKFDAMVNKIASDLDSIYHINNSPGHQVVFVFRKNREIK
jgi:ubiquinone/menaquinone biosynthesis C-methylase UbiE